MWLCYQQWRALVKKNSLLSWRNRRATFAQLLSSFFFVFLIFCIEKSIDARLSSTTNFDNLLDPDLLHSPSIPPCEHKFFVKLPCFDFAWSGNHSPKFTSIVTRIMDNNPGRPIPSHKTKSFRTSEEVDAWLFSHPMRCPGVLHFVERNSTVISYGLQTNSTPVSKRGHYEDPTFKFQIPLQIAAEREISRSLIGDTKFNWNIGFKEFAHPEIQRFSTVGAIGPTFFLAIAMFGFVFQMSSLVTEKELKLRQAMAVMGLYESSYWLSWISWEGIMTLLSSLLTVLFGMMFKFNFFMNNSFSVLFVLFFLFQLNMMGFAFMLSAFISKSSSSTTIGFLIFIVGFTTQIVTTFGFPYSKDFSDLYRSIWSFFPPNLFAKGLKLLSDATSTNSDPGISWRKRSDCAPNDSDCIITINEIYIWLVGTSFTWFILAVYFDNIIPSSSTTGKSLLYFLSPGYWMRIGGNSMGGSVVDEFVPEDEDVREEERMVKERSREGSVGPNTAVQFHGLCKTYPGTKGTCLSFWKRKQISPHQALKGLWLNIDKGQLFCLLGPNGAGKTTAINCLTGVTGVTDGEVLVYGNSVRSPSGMSNIRRIIGVCPQFDILWNQLSGREHLQLFANIKGLPPTSIKQVVRKALEEVRLTEAAEMRSGSCSGGMKRRLSVAIALMGDPKLVILDEPTTGMDPVTRRHVWDIIEETKRGRAVILTTHSMEEADILGDRIGIMAKGRLRCLGTCVRLKSKFGSGFVVSVGLHPSVVDNPSLRAAHRDRINHLFASRLDLTPKEENDAFSTFIIPRPKEALLEKFFEELEEREEELGIIDVQLGLDTLEEVFLNIVRRADLENLATESISTTLTLTSSGASLQVPVGGRFVAVPGTSSAENGRGVMVEVYWEEGDEGSFFISGHSHESPIPENAILDSSTGVVLIPENVVS